MTMPVVARKVDAPIGLFSASQVADIYDLLGLPFHGLTTNVTALFYYPYSQLETWQPSWQHGDLTKFYTALNTGMALCTQFQVDLVEKYLVTWRKISISPMHLTGAANQVTGDVVKHDEQRELIRQRVSNLLGVVIPRGGYLHEAEAVLGRSLSEFMSGSGGGRGFGDL